MDPEIRLSLTLRDSSEISEAPVDGISLLGPLRPFSVPAYARAFMQSEGRPDKRVHFSTTAEDVIE
jgi:hypothetical protein